MNIKTNEYKNINIKKINIKKINNAISLLKLQIIKRFIFYYSQFNIFFTEASFPLYGA